MLKIYVLILTFYAGPWSKGDSVSMVAQEFSSQEWYEAAGKEASEKLKTEIKPVKYICVEK